METITWKTDEPFPRGRTITGGKLVLPVVGGMCQHHRYIVAEREFYLGKHKYSGTILICKKCGKQKQIPDSSFGVYP